MFWPGTCPGISSLHPSEPRGAVRLGAQGAIQPQVPTHLPAACQPQQRCPEDRWIPLRVEVCRTMREAHHSGCSHPSLGAQESVQLAEGHSGCLCISRKHCLLLLQASGPALVLRVSGEEGRHRGTWGVDQGHRTPLGLSFLIWGLEGAVRWGGCRPWVVVRGAVGCSVRGHRGSE